MMECMRRAPAAMIHSCDMIAQDETTMVDCLLHEIGGDGIFYSVQNAEAGTEQHEGRIAIREGFHHTGAVR